MERQTSRGTWISGLALAVICSLTLGPTPADAATYSALDRTTASFTVGEDPGGSLELGLLASTTTDLWITSVSFLKPAEDSGTYVAQVWGDSDTTPLVSQAFPALGSQSGWKKLMLTTPQKISANSTFTVAVYFQGSSHYYSAGDSISRNSAAPNTLTLTGARFAYTATAVRPQQAEGRANYFIDFEFDTTNPSDVTSSGYASPVKTGINEIKAGRTVPIKFTLTQGETVIEDTTGITSSIEACEGSRTPVARGEMSALRFDSVAGQFVQNWKVPTAPGCWRVKHTLGDLEIGSATFQAR